MVINDAASNAAVRPVIRNLWLSRCAARRAGRRGLLLSKEAKRAQQKYETKQARAGLTGSVPVEHMRENSGNHRFWTEILCISMTPGLPLALRSNKLVVTVKALEDEDHLIISRNADCRRASTRVMVRGDCAALEIDNKYGVAWTAIVKAELVVWARERAKSCLKRQRKPSM
jgi:hypothetical protein